VHGVLLFGLDELKAEESTPLQIDKCQSKKTPVEINSNRYSFALNFDENNVSKKYTMR